MLIAVLILFLCCWSGMVDYTSADRTNGSAVPLADLSKDFPSWKLSLRMERNIHRGKLTLRNLTTPARAEESPFKKSSSAVAMTGKDSSQEFLERYPSRFEVPWEIVPRYKMPSIDESGHRILFSAISNVGSDGLGHAMAVLNSEVRTAMLLNISYTHRVAVYGSLTRTNARNIEDFFAWGRGEIPRQVLQDAVCNVKQERRALGASRPCQICESLKSRQEQMLQDVHPYHARARHIYVHRIVDIPFEVSNGNCPLDIDETGKRCAQVEAFREIVRASPNTVFQMGKERCSLVAAYSDFKETRPYFYWKYWGAHGRTKENGMWSPKNPSGRLPLRFSEKELVIAAHVRRGDFLVVKNRKLISCKTFAKVIRSVQEVVKLHGGNFGSLPVAVYIYSEGRMKDQPKRVQHDVTKMTRDFVDSDGITRDARWIQTILAGTEPQKDAIGSSPTTLTMPRIEMRISEDTVTSLHEMAGADIFLGSMSGMSSHVVGTISRGVQLQPNFGCQRDSRHLCFHPVSGVIAREYFREQWDKYACTFEKYLVSS